MSVTTAQTRLYLQLAAGEGAETRLRSALSAAAFDAVMIAPPAGSHRDPTALRALVTLAQSHNAAALIDGDAALAKAARADGVHLAWSETLEERYAAARQALGPADIVGVEAAASRHDAMALAEAGADYIAFTRTTPAAEADGPLFRQEALVEWWAEVFVVPCVALDVRNAAEAAALAHAGADFVGIAAEAGLSPDAMSERVRAIAAALPAVSDETATAAARRQR